MDNTLFIICTLESLDNCNNLIVKVYSSEELAKQAFKREIILATLSREPIDDLCKKHMQETFEEVWKYGYFTNADGNASTKIWYTTELVQNKL